MTRVDQRLHDIMTVFILFSKETSKKSSSKLDEEGIQVAVCRYMGRPEECDCTDDTCQSWCVETHLFINLSESHVYFLMGIPSTDFFFFAIKMKLGEVSHLCTELWANVCVCVCVCVCVR